MNLTEATKKKIAKLETPFDPVCKFFLPLIPRWVSPNQLTTVRLIGIPFLVFLLWQGFHLSSLILFLFLAFTDMLDGALARSRNQITELGTLLDPIADKLLVAAAIIVLLIKVNFSLAILVVGLDLMMILIGLIIHTTSKQPFSLKANLFGKIKLNLQVIGLAAIFLGLIFSWPLSLIIGQDILWGSIAFAMLSMVSRGF